ncbi:MAG: magnesium transporter [Ruminococcaceae bacterium]|nr:magnesium transporter [Oscillospiraceae bacterium]
MEERILSLLENKEFGALKSVLSEINPADLVVYLEAIPKNKLLLVFRILPKELAAETFVEMDSDMQILLVTAFSDREIKDILSELFVDDAADIIEEMPASVANRILKQADAQTRRDINQILAYPEDSAGSIMTTEYFDLKKDMLVADAFSRIRKIGLDRETIYTCYVTDSRRKLLGVVTAKDLLLSRPDQTIEEIMEDNSIFVTTTDDRETVVQNFEKYDLLALPVVDRENRLVGIITVDDAIDVMQEEATEDIEKMAAMLPSDKTYLKTGVFETVKARIPWLLFLMLTATFTGWIISAFESKLAVQAVLIAFIPMIMNTGGNSGSQSSVTVIRAMSLGDIEFTDIIKVFFKEFRVSLICGLVLSVVNFVKIILLDNLIMNGEISYLVAFVVSLTILATVVFAKIVGCLLPIGAKKIGLDPTVMASPFITTLVDAVSLLIYFTIASSLLSL